MPGCALHLEMATRVLRFWTDCPAIRPFPPDQPRCRDAFLFGSLAPDLGYYPGGDRLFSDLAHYIRSGELARSLIAAAQTDADRALAWGWVTHVLADAWIHPLINQAVGEHIHGNRLPGVPYADDAAAHVRVETGLDAALPVVAGWPDPPAIGRAPEASLFAPVARAYQATYGFAPSCARLYSAHRIAIALVPALLLGGRIVGGRPAGHLNRWIHGSLAGVTRMCRPRGLLTALLNPLPPPDWLLAEARAIVEAFTESFQTSYAEKLERLPDYNLDTGKVEGEPPRYTLAALTFEALQRKLAVQTPDGP
jgi:hypothetical protein